MNKSNIKILVVDDERGILEALQTHLELDGYTLDVAGSAKEALDLFQKKSHQIVLTDINMPVMDGIVLLEEIKALRGDTVVIMITAYTSLTKVLLSRAHGAADYVLKPFRDLSDVDQALDRAVEQIERWNKIIEETKKRKTNGKPVTFNAKHIIESAEIPPIPAVLQQILVLADDPSASSSDLEKLVSQEPALVSQLLKWVNSAYYALKQRVSSVSHAMILLGFSTVKSIASGLLLISAFEDLKEEDKAFCNNVWQHTLTAANFSKILSRRESPKKQDLYFLSTMIHDVGYIVLKTHFRQRYLPLTKIKKFPDHADESKALGVNHVEIGSELLKHWMFPEDVIDMVTHHHNPKTDARIAKDVAFLAVSDYISYQEDLKTFFKNDISKLPADFLKQLFITGWEWPQLQNMSDKFEDAADMTKRLFVSAA